MFHEWQGLLPSLLLPQHQCLLLLSEGCAPATQEAGSGHVETLSMEHQGYEGLWEQGWRQSEVSGILAVGTAHLVPERTSAVLKKINLESVNCIYINQIRP
jgi:hypothetical protein